MIVGGRLALVFLLTSLEEEQVTAREQQKQRFSRLPNSDAFPPPKMWTPVNDTVSFVFSLKGLECAWQLLYIQPFCELGNFLISVAFPG